MGLFGNAGMDQLPQIAPAVAASMGGAVQLPQITPQPLPVAASPQPQQAQPQQYPGLKRPPPAIGTTVNGYTYMGGDPRSQDPSVWKPASGDTFLGSLPIDDTKKAVIKAIANYELPPGSQRGGLGSPEVQQLLGFAKQYNPSFDAKDYAAIQKTRTEIANPDSRFNLTKTALNTAIDHARGLAESADALHNFQSPLLNAPLNFIDQHVLGDPRQGNFNQNAQLLAGEVVKAATGSTNGGGEGDRTQQNANYPLNGSPVQQNEAIGKTVDLLKSKLDEMTATLRQAGNPRANALDLLSPSARASWQKLSQRFGAGGTSGMGNPSPQQMATITKTINGQTFVNHNGQWYHQ